MTTTVIENGVIVSENGIHLEGGDLSVAQWTRPEDVPGLDSYSYDVVLRDLIPGEVPGVGVDVEYLPAGPNRYHAVVESNVVTENDADGSETRVRTRIDTFEVEVDPATGEELERWLFADLIDVISSQSVRIDADGTGTLSREIRVEVRNIKNDG